MKQLSSYLKKRFKSFDDSLINPPKDRVGETKNFKGQTINEKNFGDNPQPNP
jgi:hypothetical protein